MINKLLSLSFLMATLVAPVMACEAPAMDFAANGGGERSCEVQGEGIGRAVAPEGAVLEPILQKEEETEETKLVILEIYGSYCPACQRAEPIVDELMTEFGGSHKLVKWKVPMMNSGDFDSNVKEVSRAGLNFDDIKRITTEKPLMAIPTFYLILQKTVKYQLTVRSITQEGEEFEEEFKKMIESGSK